MGHLFMRFLLLGFIFMFGFIAGIVYSDFGTIEPQMIVNTVNETPPVEENVVYERSSAADPPPATFFSAAGEGVETTLKSLFRSILAVPEN
ncbi:hypothetical protein FLK61_29380 [Paenalkalicoccus suaedae]|uniref:Uncharacterized protein n=1 Tax=Paenalkalicoccus suaedae TaxID=2592382 RepID=A0A859FF34_9BACI|nr:hypothetical protein [Paenalkalicoccus suaedae]QKS70846.1 hypothetical protein FLK61_29380 [Paenalkalicoccus suaedae]